MLYKHDVSVESEPALTAVLEKADIENTALLAVSEKNRLALCEEIIYSR
jgi:hypothetical protein